MLTTPGAAARTTGAKESVISAREAGTCWLSAGAFAAQPSTNAAQARAAQRRPRTRGRPRATSGSERPPAAGTRAARAGSGCGRGRLALVVAHRRRAGILSFGCNIAVDELDHRHRRIVAVAEAGLEDPHVAAGATLVAGAQHVDQLGRCRLVAGLGDQQAA